MSSRRFSIGLRVALTIFTVTLFVTSAWAQAPWERVLYSFKGTDGANPYASLVMDTRSGNLYGTTYSGGAYGAGVAFELYHKVGGGWGERVLYNFGAAGTDGANPYASLIWGAPGNLYGTTASGGAYGNGTVFQLRQHTGGSWTEQVLHSFNGANGSGPFGGLIFDAAGSLYGTTNLGGAYGYGTVFQLSPQADGGWTENAVYGFCPLRPCRDGDQPHGGLVFDTNGNLYGTTDAGGAYISYGTVFELSPNGDGSWTEQVLHSFNGAEDVFPDLVNLIFDARGNLYGTTEGTVFELSPQAAGGWTEKVLWLGASDPNSGVIFDAAGNLYGTTYYGGYYSVGMVFELSPQADGGWTERTLHSFDPKCHNDGAYPVASVIIDAHGNLYGTTRYGGAYGNGTVFEITP